MYLIHRVQVFHADIMLHFVEEKHGIASQLMLLHHARSAGATCVQAARRIFPPILDWVADGQTIVLGNEGS
jgi:hypothetical protein